MNLNKISFAVTALIFDVALSSSSLAQWTDRKLMGTGGESTVATDGKGNVYVTSHQPVKVYTSHDWGSSFETNRVFPDGFCDTNVITWPNGNVSLSFIKPNVAGLATYYSVDQGRNFLKGGDLNGPYDREWLAPNLVNDELYMDYSDGYIGGPKSKGVFLAASADAGKSFEVRSRVDKESDTDYAVDPYLQTSSDGRIYAMWSTSKDYNAIDRFDFAYSTDNGKSFKGHTTIGSLHKDRGDCQERWVLGCISAFGKNQVIAVYPDYGDISVNGTTYHPLLMFYRVSVDGGETFSAPRTVSPHTEIVQNITSFEQNRRSDQNYPYYIQTLPWTCADPYGRFYVAYEDNRDGQGAINGTAYDRWQVRFASLNKLGNEFSASEQVSDDTVCKRPPLDFLSCAADSKRAYVSWTQTPNALSDWLFTGDLYLGRKILAKPLQ